jgi:hypothetical protein
VFVAVTRAPALGRVERRCADESAQVEGNEPAQEKRAPFKIAKMHYSALFSSAGNSLMRCVNAALQVGHRPTGDSGDALLSGAEDGFDDCGTDAGLLQLDQSVGRRIKLAVGAPDLRDYDRIVKTGFCQLNDVLVF